MAKLAKNMYRSLKTGERKLNCYVVNISKQLVEDAKIDPDKEIIIYVKDNKIIIEKA